MDFAGSPRAAASAVEGPKPIGRRRAGRAYLTRQRILRFSAILMIAALVVPVRIISAVPSHIALTNLGSALARMSTCGSGTADWRRPPRRPLCESAAVKAEMQAVK